MIHSDIIPGYRLERADSCTISAYGYKYEECSSDQVTLDGFRVH